jgi:hypothetical protein
VSRVQGTQPLTVRVARVFKVLTSSVKAHRQAGQPPCRTDGQGRRDSSKAVRAGCWTPRVTIDCWCRAQVLTGLTSSFRKASSGRSTSQERTSKGAHEHFAACRRLQTAHAHRRMSAAAGMLTCLVTPFEEQTQLQH